ncbi:hypothetical protein DFJ58DRAFT_728062 [Suillus subalutaceus]|uniref:uncharacterized protein n=1 Tax=Suillus subalutaceus TaxID=48586 RepID=UPI001B86E28A|nr:uncharacterized protein DFJ58DRAFT_728062 [Suillus subalutaceus]KAG1853928.1 hypothetical protein DFJ58DRAFT_728062 [Suillus subalutaceus]
MSEPASAVPKRMMTRPKNATQHPGRILTEAEGYTKRRTKAQKFADDKREKEEKQASEMAVQEGYKRVAAFEKKMQTDQAAKRADAPKPTRPRPRPVKKVAKPMETSNSTMAEDQAIGAKGKGGRARDKSAAGANVEHPESDAEDEEQEARVPGARKKKGKRTVLPVKTPVRDAIEAAGLIDDSESTMPRDNDKKSGDVSTAGPAKFGVAAGRISHWRLEIPEELTSAAAASKHRRPSTMPSDFSSMVPSSKLTRGSTVSSGGAPLTPINTITGAGADSMADHFVTLFADDDLDESVERSQALARMSKPKGAAQGVKISSMVPDTSIQANSARRNTNLAPKQLNTLEPDTVTDDNGDMDVEVARPAVASLVNYASDTDMESDLEPPPSTQVPKGYYDDDIRRAVALNRKPASYPTTPSTETMQLRTTTIEDALLEDAPFEDDIMVGDDFGDDHASMIEEDLLSSEVEFISHIKPIVKVESKPVSLRVTSTVTNVGVKHKAPVTKRTKSSIAHTHSLSSISSAGSGAALGPVEVEILPRSAYRIKNLPGGPRAVTRWSAVFIPTLISAVGDQDEDTWNAVYGDIPHTVTPDGPVMALATQRLSEWRNGVGTTAITVLTHFMSTQDDIESDEDRKDFAKNLRLKLGFLYGSITEDGKYKQPFQSELLVQVLVQHSKGKAVKVPHSLNKVTGKASNALKAFSDTNYGEATRGYMKSINQLRESVLQDVWERTKEIAVKRRHGGASTILDEDSDDERAIIVDDDW